MKFSLCEIYFQKFSAPFKIDIESTMTMLPNENKLANLLGKNMTKGKYNNEHKINTTPIIKVTAKDFQFSAAFYTS